MIGTGRKSCVRYIPFDDGVADGTRTRDNRNHNPGLYQLSYSHRRDQDSSMIGVDVLPLCLTFP